MKKNKTSLVIVVSLWFYILIFGGWVIQKPVIYKKPVIYSYFWPISKGQNDLLRLNMEMPTIIDIPWQNRPAWLVAKEYWEKKGKVILYRVYPFKGIKTEDEMYNLFAKNMEKSKGIAIDEILPRKLKKEQGEKFVKVLKKIRKNFPDRIIAVWCAGSWNSSTSYILEAIRDYADLYLPELYISQSAEGQSGIEKFRLHIEASEALVPGIKKKMLVGLGMFPKMKDDSSKSFMDHLSAQITLLGTDPFFKDILGIALYAPVYNSAEDQKFIDSLLKKYFSK